VNRNSEKKEKEEIRNQMTADIETSNEMYIKEIIN